MLDIEWVRNKPRTASTPDREKYPYASAAKSAERAQQIIGWKTFLTLAGNLNSKTHKDQQLRKLIYIYIYMANRTDPF